METELFRAEQWAKCRSIWIGLIEINEKESNMEKSPVEFIVDKLTPSNWTKEQMQEHYKDAIEQAKEMEEEQIDNAWDRGYKQGYYDPEFEKENIED